MKTIIKNRINKLALIGFGLLATVCLMSCESNNVYDYKKEISKLRKDLEDLKSSLKAEYISRLDLAIEFYDSKNKLRELEWEVLRNKKVEPLCLNVKQNDGYSILHSSAGQFFVFVKDVQPYLDGYKITFSFGNPSSATFYDPKIKLRWNGPFDFNKINTELSEDEFKKQSKELSDAWKNSFKEKKFNGLSEFAPGSWTRVELFINPCSVNELEHVEVSIETPTVRLN